MKDIMHLSVFCGGLADKTTFGILRNETSQRLKVIECGLSYKSFWFPKKFQIIINSTMVGESRQQSPDNESGLPRVYRRKSNEQAIKDTVVVFGSLLMFMCFGMLLESNLREWGEAQQRRVAIVSFLCLCLFVFLFLLYLYSRTKKTVRRCFCQRSCDDTLPNVSRR